MFNTVLPANEPRIKHNERNKLLNFYMCPLLYATLPLKVATKSNGQKPKIVNENFFSAKFKFCSRILYCIDQYVLR